MAAGRAVHVQGGEVASRTAGRGERGVQLDGRKADNRHLITSAYKLYSVPVKLL